MTGIKSAAQWLDSCLILEVEINATLEMMALKLMGWRSVGWPSHVG